MPVSLASHYDPYSQALAKLERGHARDLADVIAMLDRDLISREKLWHLFLAIEPHLQRFPSVYPATFRQAVEIFCEGGASSLPRPADAYLLL